MSIATQWVLVCAALVAGCSSGTTNPSPSPTPTQNPPAQAPDAGQAPPPPPEVNGCTSYADMTAGGATIDGPMDFNPAQFSPNCVQIKAGQSVTWNVDFAAHPLAASGGDSPSPIATTSSGTTVTFTFPNAGAFGYHCLAHPTIMFGAVDVVP